MAASNIRPRGPVTDDILQCPLCLHQLEKPVTLKQCLHTYCKECLDELPQGDITGWTCPKCGKFSCTDEVKQNDFVERVLHSKTAKFDINPALTCKQCLRTSEIQWKCSDCRIELCTSCKTGHLNIPLLKGHTIVPIETEGENYIDEVVYCDVHKGNVIELNCKDCEVPLCLLCKIENHDTHSSETVYSSVNRLVQQLEAGKISLAAKMDQLERYISTVKGAMEATKKCFTEDRKQLTARFEDLKESLQNIKDEQEDALTSRESESLKVLKEMKIELEGKLEQMKQLQSMSSLTTSAAQNVSLLCQLQDGLVSKLEESSCGGNETRTLNISLPTRRLSVNGEELNIKLKDLFGRRNIMEHTINSQDKSDSREFKEESLHKILEINLSGYCNGIVHINGHIWVSVDNSIHVYDLSCKLHEALDLDFCPLAITILPTGHIGIGTDMGLYVLKNNRNSEPACLADGHISSVVIYENDLYALNCETSEILMFKLRRNHQEGNAGLDTVPWYKDSTVKLQFNMKGNSSNTFCRVEDAFVVSSLEDNCLLVFDTQGSLKSKSMQDRQLSICGVDEHGGMFLADYDLSKY